MKAAGAFSGLPRGPAARAGAFRCHQFGLNRTRDGKAFRMRHRRVHARKPVHPGCAQAQSHRNGRRGESDSTSGNICKNGADDLQTWARQRNGGLAVYQTVAIRRGGRTNRSYAAP